jgi:hypothetical protein
LSVRFIQRHAAATGWPKVLYQKLSVERESRRGESTRDAIEAGAGDVQQLRSANAVRETQQGWVMLAGVERKFPGPARGSFKKPGHSGTGGRGNKKRRRSWASLAPPDPRGKTQGGELARSWHDAGPQNRLAYTE